MIRTLSILTIVVLISACGRTIDTGAPKEPEPQGNRVENTILEGRWLTNLSQIDKKIRRMTVKGNTILHEEFSQEDDGYYKRSDYTFTLSEKKSPTGYMTHEIKFYDADGNLVKTEVCRRDETSIVIGPSDQEYRRYHKN